MQRSINPYKTREPQFTPRGQTYVNKVTIVNKIPHLKCVTNITCMKAIASGMLIIPMLLSAVILSSLVKSTNC